MNPNDRKASSSKIPSIQRRFGFPSNKMLFIPKPDKIQDNAATKSSSSHTAAKPCPAKRNQLVFGNRTSQPVRSRPYPQLYGSPHQSPAIKSLASKLDFGGPDFGDTFNNFHTPGVSEPKFQTPTKSPFDFKNSKILASLKKCLSEKKEEEIPACNWNLLHKDAEIIKIKMEMKQLDNTLEDTKRSKEELKINLEKDIDLLKRDVELQKDINANMRIDMNRFQEKLISSDNQLDSARGEFNKEKEKYDNLILDLEKKNQQLRSRENELTIEKVEITRQQNTDLIQRDHLILNLQNEVANAAAEKSIYGRQLQELCEYTNQVAQLQKQLEESQKTVETLQRTLEDFEEGKKIAEVLKDEINELLKYKEVTETLTTENLELKKIDSDRKLLEGEIELLQNDLEEAKKSDSKIAALEEECKTLKNELKDWEFCSGSTLPAIISSRISEFERNEQNLLSEIENLKAHLTELKDSQTIQVQPDNPQNQDEELSKLVLDLQKKLSEQAYDLKRLSRKSLLFSKERDSYKKVIESYEHDITINPAMANSERISELERNLQEYRDLITQLEKEANAQHSTAIEKVTEKMEIDQAAHDANTKILDENKLPECKIIHLMQNPLQEAIDKKLSQYEKMEDENRKLSARIEVLESGENADVSRQVLDGIQAAADLEKLKEQLVKGEKRRDHIINAFKKTSKEFREVVWILTGYKIDALKEKIYRFSHVYSDSPSDVLLFQLEENSSMKLLQNDFSEKLSELADTYLGNHDSFPAFLASLTLDLFKRQTHFAIAQ